MENNCEDLNLCDFNYNLPEKLIAQEPLKSRSSCRLLFLNKEDGSLKESSFSDLLSALKAGDLLVLNNSKVIPARLIGTRKKIVKKKEISSQIEIFLHKKISDYKEDEVWEVLVHGRVKTNTIIIFSKDFFAEIIRKNEDGSCLISFNHKGLNFWKNLDIYGQVPLPPYIKRKEKSDFNDKLYYQTVFASDEQAASVAAPTAGLHFTNELLQKIKDKGVEIVEITLHVGLGTFASIRTEKIREHKMHEELVIIKKDVAQKIINQKRCGKRVVAVGTTVCRALESWAQRLPEKNKNPLIDDIFWTDIFIAPGYKFLLIDAMLTNFHLPQSTLLILVSAFAGKQNIFSAYDYAMDKKFRFFSYGDAMFIS